MGCPVPKIAKHHAGCSLMREPEHAATVIKEMAKAVQIPVTVKMRAGWNDRFRNAPELAQRVQDAGAAAVTIHGRTAEQSYSGSADWNLVFDVASKLSIPVLGSGDLIYPEQIVDRLNLRESSVSRPESRISGALVGRGVLRNPWILAQAADLVAGRTAREVTLADRGQFLLDYIDLLLREGLNEAGGFRHAVAPGRHDPEPAVMRHPACAPSSSRQRWVINKLRALCAWYSRGIDSGSHLRIRVNSASSIDELRDIVNEFFLQHSHAPGFPSQISPAKCANP
jgi:tRNA-dihydrouridine synthase B